MPCSICRERGHNFKTCPTISEEKRKELIDQRKKKKEELDKRREAERKKKEEYEKNNILLDVHNPNDYDIVVFWGFNYYPDRTQDRVIYLATIGAYSMRKIKIFRNKHRIVVYPLEEVPRQDLGPFAYPAFGIQFPDITNSSTTEKVKLFDMNMEDYEISENKLDIPKVHYSPKKNELDQWKEFALKSHFILKEIEKFTTKDGDDGYKVVHEKYDAIGEFVEMIQDIKEPDNVSEVDRELAGVPSRLTNIT